MLVVDVIEEAGKVGADSAVVFIEGDLLLSEHKLFAAGVFDIFGELVGQLGGGSAGFGVECEAAEVVELCPSDEFEQLFELVLCFAGEADDDGGSEYRVGDSGAEFFEKGGDLEFFVGAVHGF